ncbi:MAG TPA: hypothetical protein VLX68_11340 [Chitinivibrionales bacterium]|nr:hypothetical protein [Chitinivibrionales bacterium]
MLENNKKTIITNERWAHIIDFLIQNESRVKSLVADTIHPEMLRIDVMLKNIADGVPSLGACVALPRGKNDIVALSFVRPSPFNPGAVKMRIDSITIEEIINMVSNQIEVR